MERGPMTLQTLLIEPSGVVQVPVGAGSYLERRHSWPSVLQLEDEPSGLIAEMESGRRPVPWASAKQRDLALLQLAFDRPDLDEGLRDRLIAHVRATPVYERDDPWDLDEGAYKAEMLARRRR